MRRQSRRWRFPVPEHQVACEEQPQNAPNPRQAARISAESPNAGVRPGKRQTRQTAMPGQADLISNAIRILLISISSKTGCLIYRLITLIKMRRNTG